MQRLTGQVTGRVECMSCDWADVCYQCGVNSSRRAEAGPSSRGGKMARSISSPTGSTTRWVLEAGVMETAGHGGSPCPDLLLLLPFQAGFGRPDGEYWLGLEPVHQVTSRGDHELLILLEDWGGRGARAHYDSFSLEPESDHYRLRLGQYHGDAGDSLSWHNDKPFSTVDRDRDSYSGKESFFKNSGGRAGRWGS